MRDSTLLKISMTTFIIGMFGLYAIEYQCWQGQFEGESDSGIQEVTGKLVKLAEYDNVLRLSILNNNSVIPVTLFSDGRINLKEGARLKIRSQKSEYQGQDELIAESIKVFE